MRPSFMLDTSACIHVLRGRAPFDALPARKGTPIGPMDLLIAAHARNRGATLITRNAREFHRVDGLKVLA